MMGSSNYNVEQFKDLRLTDAMTSMVSPAIFSVSDFVEDQARIITELSEEGYDWSAVDKKNFRTMPGVGEMYYNFFGGGIEDFLEKEERDRNKD